MQSLPHLVAFCVVLASVISSFAEDKPQAIVERAIQAQGGEAKLAKLQVMRIKVEGITDLIPGKTDLPLTIEDTWQMPARYKTTSTFELMGNKVTQTQTIDGDKGWVQINGQTQDLPKAAITEMKEQKWAEDLDRLAFFKDKAIELAALDETKVDGKPAIGVLVRSKGHRDVKLFFDKASGLLVKREQKVLEPSSSKEVSQEVVFSDYHEKEGVKHYKRIALYRDGKKLLDGKVMEIEFFDKLDDKVFAKP
jgi:hypothetical protein